MEFTQHPDLAAKLDNYPEHIQPKLTHLRTLILEAAQSLASVQALEETLKWGELSYLTKHGSTIRIDWKKKSPDDYRIYFKCTSLLVPTIKEIYGDLFQYENNRAIIIPLNASIPEAELKDCISMALEYHKVKKIPLLGR